MTLIEFFYPSDSEIKMYTPYKVLPHAKAVAIGRIIQLAVSLLIFIQQGLVSHKLSISQVQEYLQLAFYSQIFQFIAYTILIIECFAFPKITGGIPNAYKKNKLTYIPTLIAHGLYELAWVGFYIGVIQFLVSTVPTMKNLPASAGFYMLNVSLIFFVLMTIDLVFSKIYFIVMHIIYGLIWMTVWEIIFCVCNKGLKNKTFGENVSYCVAMDFLYASFFVLAASYQNWKMYTPSKITEVQYEEIAATDKNEEVDAHEEKKKFSYEEVLLKYGDQSKEAEMTKQKEVDL